MCDGCRLPGAHPQQYRSLRRPAAAARAGALAAALPQLVERTRARGLPGGGRLSAHRHGGRRQGLGQLRLCADAGIPLGHLPRRAGAGPHHRLRRRDGQARLAGGSGRAPGRAPPADRDAGRHRARLGRAAAPPRPQLPLALRPAQPLPGQCRGGPPPLGDGLSAARPFRPRRARGGGGTALPPLRRPGQSAHPDYLQRADRRLALLLHVHLFHRPGRQVPAEVLRRVGLRPARAHLLLHADGRGPPHVRRRDGHRADRPAHAGGDAGPRHRRPGRGARPGRHRPADAPALHQFLVLLLARPVRLRDLVQRRNLFRRGPQGPARRSDVRGPCVPRHRRAHRGA